MSNLPKKGPGRPKGAQNKITADIRAMIEGALAKKGGQRYLEEQATENPVAFLTLVGKCLPKDVTLSGSVGQYSAQPIPVEHRQSDGLKTNVANS